MKDRERTEILTSLYDENMRLLNFDYDDSNLRELEHWKEIVGE